MLPLARRALDLLQRFEVHYFSYQCPECSTMSRQMGNAAEGFRRFAWMLTLSVPQGRSSPTWSGHTPALATHRRRP
jgi:hypothetical protein